MAETQLRFLRSLLYKLKRQFGKTIDIYRLDSSVVNRETGKKTIVKTKYTIKKAIVLTNQEARSFQYDKSYISAAKNFTYGAWFDVDSRLFIIDSVDLPVGFKILIDDFIIFGQQRFEIKNATIADTGYYMSVMGKSVEGGIVGQIHDVAAGNILRIAQTVLTEKV